jgi:hypothetical protein
MQRDATEKEDSVGMEGLVLPQFLSHNLAQQLLPPCRQTPCLNLHGISCNMHALPKQKAEASVKYGYALWV